MQKLRKNIVKIVWMHADHLIRVCRVSLRDIGVGLSIVLLVAAGGVFVWKQVRTPVGQHIVLPPPEQIPAPPEVIARRSWIDGSPLLEEQEQPNGFAIVVDNAPEARPQSGLSDATLVFEFPVEGQRTRFIAVFSDEASAKEVGPVRSARPYFVALAGALGVPLVHVGGSPAALDLLRVSATAHVNQYYDPPFWRSTRRVAPFNVYTAIADLRDFWTGRHPDTVARDDVWHLWNWADGISTIGEGIAIEHLPFAYSAALPSEWRYDRTTDRYTRFQNGQVHRDLNGHAITATNVVIMHVATNVVDRVGRLEIPSFEHPVASEKLLPARVCTHGTCRDDDWGISSPDDGLFGMRGTLQPGTTWVEVLNTPIPPLESSGA